MLDKEFYNIRAEISWRLFPKGGEHAYSLHENLVLDKVMSMAIWENRGLDLCQYYYQEKTIFPDGGIFFFGRKYYISEERLLYIIEIALEILSKNCCYVLDLNAFLNGSKSNMREGYLCKDGIQKVSAKIEDFTFMDGFILYEGSVCRSSNARKSYNEPSIKDGRKINIYVDSSTFEFCNSKDEIKLLNVYKAIKARKVVLDVNNVVFEDGYVLFNPIPTFKIYKKSRLKLPYSKSLYNQYKDKTKLRTITVAVDNGKVIDFANKSIKQCILSIRKSANPDRYVKSLLKIDSLKPLFEDFEINCIFDGDKTLSKSISKFRKALGIGQKENSVSVALNAIKKEASLCRGNASCIVSCRKDFCKFDACFKIMLSHVSKYPVLLFDEPYEYGNGYRYIKNMIITSEHLFNSDNVYIVIKAINETKRKTFQFTVPRYDYYKALFAIYTYFSSEMFWKRKSDYFMKYLQPFGVISVDVFKY